MENKGAQRKESRTVVARRPGVHIALVSAFSQQPPTTPRPSVTVPPPLQVYLYSTHPTVYSQCPTPPPAPAKQSPPSRRQPGRKRSPERPSQKAPFVLSRAATPAGFDGRFVVEALITLPAQPNPDLPSPASFFHIFSLSSATLAPIFSLFSSPTEMRRAA